MVAKLESGVAGGIPAAVPVAGVTGLYFGQNTAFLCWFHDALFAQVSHISSYVLRVEYWL